MTNLSAVRIAAISQVSQEVKSRHLIVSESELEEAVSDAILIHDEELKGFDPDVWKVVASSATSFILTSIEKRIPHVEVDSSQRRNSVSEPVLSV